MSDETTESSLSAKDVPDDLVIEVSSSTHLPDSGDSLEVHAARILLLLRHAGGRRKPKKGKIVGRTKLAKLDFFVRYPSYLAKAQNIERHVDTPPRPESPMIRYKYGPWDTKYYDVFAVLVARGLITVSPSTKGDVFSLTERGFYATDELSSPEFDSLIKRCEDVYRLFGNKSGTAIKKFIYENFPEIVQQPLHTEIEP